MVVPSTALLGPVEGANTRQIYATYPRVIVYSSKTILPIIKPALIPAI